jgi:hypothetical protein
MYLKKFSDRTEFHIFTHTTHRYPGLWRKQATFDERKKIEAQGVISAQSTNNITLVKALEIDDVIDGLDEKVISINYLRQCKRLDEFVMSEWFEYISS